MDNNIGKMLDGRYELEELIGVGGMADIYRAHDIVDNRTVAVKILKSELAGSDDFLRRFRNESKAIALLSHPNIVKIYDVGFSDTIQFIVMEYIDGINLTEYIYRQGVLKWKDAIHFTLQVLKSLQHAHDRGIVHRDIKSQNIMLLADGTIKVMDFGIARFNRETSKTLSEKAIGSVHYISPEQARGDITDEKSDIYSVGVMLYEMLTGKKPFDGDNPVSIALMHMQTQPKKPTEINSTIPEGLEEITLKAMQKEPEKRYQTAGEMIKDIEEFKKNPSIVFEYKYFSTEGTPKYFEKQGRAGSNVEKGGPGANVNKRNRFNEIDEQQRQDYVQYDEDEDYDEYDEATERRSPLLSILFAVASAFVILTAVLIYKIVTDGLGGMLNAPEQEVPKFVGLSYDEVIAKYDSEYEIIYNQEHSADTPKDYVIRQDVRAGTKIKKGQQIVIYVSDGPQMIELDDYGNGVRHRNEVVMQIEKQGFVVTQLPEDSETVPENYVIRTEPPARTLLKEGDEVIVVVSLGMVGATAKVPDFLNLDRTTAEENAKLYKLITSIVEVESEEPEGTVIFQSIEPGVNVPTNTVIELKVSSGKAPTKTGSFTLSDFPRNAVGNYKIEYYIDAILQEEKTTIQNFELNGSIKWEYEGSGVQRYAIYLTSEETGARGKFYECEIDFTGEGKPERTDIFLSRKIFTELKEGTSSNEPSEPEEPDDSYDEIIERVPSTQEEEDDDFYNEATIIEG